MYVTEQAGGPGDDPAPLLGRSYKRIFSQDLAATFRHLLRSSKVITILGCNNPWLSSEQVPHLRAMVMCVDADCDLLAAKAQEHQQAGRSWQYYCLSPRTTGAPTIDTLQGHLGVVQYTTPLMVPDTLVMMQPKNQTTPPSLLEAAALLGRPHLQTLLVQTQGAEVRHLLVRELVGPGQAHTLYSSGRNELGDQFAEVYATQAWSAQGNGSGPGSTLAFTEALRHGLVAWIQELGIRSLLDASCGGMAWMPLVIQEVRRRDRRFRYMGVDTACPLIQRHTATFRPNASYMSFTCLDAAHAPLPRGYDAILSRDTLQHLPYEDIYAILHNVAQSGARYFLVGSYLQQPTNENLDLCKAGKDFFNINLLASPFWLRPPPLKILQETSGFEGHPKKSLLLFDLQQLYWAEPLDMW